MTSISKTVAELLKDVGAMLRGPKEIAEELAQPRHTDPHLREKGALLKLAARMWNTKVVRGCAAAKAYTCAFTVVKQVHANGDIYQHLIFELRRGNQFWKNSLGQPCVYFQRFLGWTSPAEWASWGSQPAMCPTTTTAWSCRSSSRRGSPSRASV